MNVFIVGSPLETARVLDRRRLNKQIIECEQILDALSGKKAWSNHPCTLQYKEHYEWLCAYLLCLEHYKDGHLDLAQSWSDNIAEGLRPPFHTEEFFNQMKRRLYTKNPEHYAQWADLGTSEVNWYFVDDEWRYYKNGKRIKE